MDTLDDKVKNLAPKGSMKKIGIKYALIGAIVYMLIDTLIPYLMGNMDVEKIYEAVEGGANLSANISSLGLTAIKLIAYTFIYFSAVKEYRALNGGFITMGQGFKVAYVSVFLKAILIAVWVFIFFQFIHTEYLSASVEILEETLSEVSADIDDESGVMGTYTKFMKILMSPIGMAVSTFLSTLTGGAILSLVAAAIGKRERTM